MLKEFHAKFPDLFQGINKYPNNDAYDAREVFGHSQKTTQKASEVAPTVTPTTSSPLLAPYHQRLIELKDWLSTAVTLTLPLVDDDVLMLGDDDILSVRKD